ncbi:hypothetical protein GGR58DRAFT_501965 [Xylaria digitata]|nr:hypothetical protein GGR58DRAFT_501965 [Xylaria digitata]
MFISQFVVAGCLLALSAASPAKYPFSYETASKYFVHPTPKNFIKPTPKWPIVHTPKYIATPPPVPTPTPTPTTPSYPVSSYETLPASCYTTFDAYGYPHATVKTHSCYTQTSLFPAAPCPTLSCPPIPTDLVCAEYIKVSSITVPCATDCCPTTSTVYKADYSAPCPTCDPCRIPTEWITYTTGCAATPTITEVNVVTPAYPTGYPV